MIGLPDIQTVEPLDPQVKRHIAYYFFLKETDQSVNLEFWHYPHYHSTLLFCKNGEVIVKDDTRFILPTNVPQYSFFFNNNMRDAKREIVKGAFDLLGIVFKPLGINYFLGQSGGGLELDKLIENFGHTIKQEISQIFDAKDLSDKARHLDALCRIRYQALPTQIIEKVVAQVLRLNGDIELTQLSADLKTSRRSLLRYFKQYLGCTFREFKAVVKFRTALEQGVEAEGTNKLTELAYHAGYYDQSDLIKNFRVMTNGTPKKLFKEIVKMEDEFLWKISD